MSVSLKHKSLSKKPCKGTNKRAKYKINSNLFILSSESTFDEVRGTNNSEHTTQFIRKTDKFNISVGKEATFKYLVSEHFWHILQKIIPTSAKISVFCVFV